MVVKLRVSNICTSKYYQHTVLPNRGYRQRPKSSKARLKSLSFYLSTQLLRTIYLDKKHLKVKNASRDRDTTLLFLRKDIWEEESKREPAGLRSLLRTIRYCASWVNGLLLSTVTTTIPWPLCQSYNRCTLSPPALRNRWQYSSI